MNYFEENCDGLPLTREVSVDAPDVLLEASPLLCLHLPSHGLRSGLAPYISLLQASTSAGCPAKFWFGAPLLAFHIPQLTGNRIMGEHRVPEWGSGS